MEIALQDHMPTYSGGLGVLAGDTIRSAADLELPLVAVSPLYRKGYFYQKLDDHGHQSEEPMEWVIDDYLTERAARVTVPIEGREVQIRAWTYEVEGRTGHVVPVIFLDTDLPENAEQDRQLSHHLYGGDQKYRLSQEVVLGIGGVEMLDALGYEDLDRYHMNEGHAALLTLALLRQSAEMHGHTEVTEADAKAVRSKCLFTTHTPVPAGHDTFPFDLVSQVLPASNEADTPYSIDLVTRALELGRDESTPSQEGVLNMTHLALGLSHYVNGVAKKHGEVSRTMFNDPSVDSITNGVHVRTWVMPPFAELFDEHLPEWRDDSFALRNAFRIPRRAVWDAHQEAKKQMIADVQQRTNVALDQDAFTIGFARRVAPYKRSDLLFSDLDRLRRIADEVGPFQVVMAGKAHPKDSRGKEIIQRIFDARDALGAAVKVAYLPNYDMNIAGSMIAGTDLWLNTPRPPNEASGTSGMKAALNGVPHFSTLDGWWLEGWIEGVTGWAIGQPGDDENPDPKRHADAIYGKLRHVILPLYHHSRSDFVDVMRHAIALNGSFFHTQRMVDEYVVKAYL